MNTWLLLTFGLIGFIAGMVTQKYFINGWVFIILGLICGGLISYAFYDSHTNLNITPMPLVAYLALASVSLSIIIYGFCTYKHKRID